MAWDLHIHMVCYRDYIVNSISFIFRKVWLVCVSMALFGVSVSAYQVPCMPDMLETARYKQHENKL